MCVCGCMSLQTVLGKQNVKNNFNYNLILNKNFGAILIFDSYKPTNIIIQCHPCNKIKKCTAYRVFKCNHQVNNHVIKVQSI